MNEGAEEPRSLEELLDRIRETAEESDRTSLGAILGAVGRRSFGPVVLVAGIITLMPIVGDVPGVPTSMGILVVLSVGQLAAGRDHFWLPKWFLNRSAPREGICKGLTWLRRPARFLDRLTRSRLERFTSGAGMYVMAVACLLVAAAMPFMEVVPFSANGAGAALTAFGLAIIARDGLLALIALTLTLGTFMLVLYNLM